MYQNEITVKNKTAKYISDYCKFYEMYCPELMKSQHVSLVYKRDVSLWGISSERIRLNHSKTTQ